MRKNLIKLAAVLGLLVISTSAFASFIHVDDDGVWWECWYVEYTDHNGYLASEVVCQLYDHMPPIQP